jgi:hypothetical protein
MSNKKASHWFWVEPSKDELGDDCFLIFTQGLGNHPAGKYWYADLDELRIAIKSFLSDGYENMSKVQY